MRAQAESLMVDTCTITRPAGPPTFNADTGQYSDPVAPLTVYTGKCRIRTRTSVLRDRITQAGEAEVVIWPYIVAVPVTDVDVAVLDIVTITASTDPALVGHAMRVRIANLATNATARRLDCEEIA
jgi:hypothetical protein